MKNLYILFLLLFTFSGHCFEIDFKDPSVASIKNLTVLPDPLTSLTILGVNILTGSAATNDIAAVWTDFDSKAKMVAPTLGQSFIANSITYRVTKATLPYEVQVVQRQVTNLPVTVNIPAMVTNAGNDFAVTSIGERAFFERNTITSVTIPSSVTTINNEAFSSCYGLTSINIPNSVTSIGSGLFFSCGNLSSVTIGSGITHIKDNTFNGCLSLTSVTIPNWITRIGQSAFQNSGLTSVTIPNSVTSIDTEAFYGCEALTSVNIPNSLTSIGVRAFGYCPLTSVLCDIEIPLVITADVFAYVNLSNCSLTVPDASGNAYRVTPVWSGFSPILCKNIPINTTTIAVCNSYMWPQNGQTYSSTGIYYSGLINGCLTEKLDLTILSFSISGINYEVTSPTTVAVSGYQQASGSVVIPSTITTSCGTYEVSSIAAYAFERQENLTSISIPNTVTNIGEYAFGITGLTSLIIPNSVTSISEGVFIGCLDLTSVSIPNSVTSIGNYAFALCSALPSVSIPNSVTSIGEYAFKDCSALTSVSIPNSVMSIGEYAFYVSGLTSVTIPNSVTSLSKGVFSYCDALTSISIPNSVTSIGGFAFADCRALRSITIPNSVTSIGESAFADCHALTSVSMSNSVTSISDRLFSYCTALTSVSIPNSVTSIGEGVFIECFALTSVNIPNSVTSIAEYAFVDTHLTSVTVHWATPLIINNTVFERLTLANVTLNVPATTAAAYNATAVWQDFNPIVEPISTTWNGFAWSNGIPDVTKAVIFTGNYSSALTITALSLIVQGTAQVTIPSGFNVTVAENIIVDPTASLIFENNANLIQTTDVLNIGNITIKRNSNALMHLDYTVWSSPVSGQQLQSFSPATLANRFYTYNPILNKYSAATPTSNFAKGTGYLIRMPNNHPTTPTVWNGSFTGVPNNGNITLTIDNTTYNSIGNPYPSTISANDFITANSLTEPLYFWRKTNGTGITAYATYTLAGGTANAGGMSSIVPNGTIQIGQGFIAKSTSTQFVFTNAMRTTNNDNQFLKTKAIEKHRIWLNLAQESAPINQMMVAYMIGATAGIDPALDGKFFNDSPIALNSIINAEEFVIQAKGLPFDDSDSVALTFKTNVTGNYTISIDHVDGLFLGNQKVFLKDNVTGMTHNLKHSSYTFASAVGTFNNRFELVYKSSGTLGINDSEFANSVVVFKQNGVLNINSGSNSMKTVRIFDIQGRLIFKQENINKNNTILKGFVAAKQTVLVQITADNDRVTTKKVLF